MEMERVSTAASMSRRTWLAGGAATLAGGAWLTAGCQPNATPQSAPAANPENSMAAIDAHVHVWTPDTTAYPLAEGYTLAAMLPPSFTPEELMSHAQPCGVERVVLIQMSFYGFDNRYMLDTIARFPGVYSGVAVIDPADEQIETTMSTLRKQGVRGYRLAPFARDPAEWFGRPGIERMWRCGAEQGQAMCLLINPNSFDQVDSLCTRFPDTPAVIDHYARIGADGQIREADVDRLCSLAKHPRMHVKLSAFYALGAKQPPHDDLKPLTRRLLDAYGPERLMWATDCPYQVQPGYTYRESVDFITARCDFLSAGDRDWIMRRTAERFFFSA